MRCYRIATDQQMIDATALSAQIERQLSRSAHHFMALQHTTTCSIYQLVVYRTLRQAVYRSLVQYRVRSNADLRSGLYLYRDHFRIYRTVIITNSFETIIDLTVNSLIHKLVRSCFASW
ncbi:hypothetical protein D3C80_1328690 [compost metagenome]